MVQYRRIVDRLELNASDRKRHGTKQPSQIGGWG
jgi:hypothetical protein